MMAWKPCAAVVVGACLTFPLSVWGEDDKAAEWKVNAEELGRYYEEKGKPPPWSEAVEALFAEDQTNATKAARFLVDLATQVLADETSGTSRWRATPYWGSEGENRARSMREYMISSIAERAKKSGGARGLATLPVLEWFIRKEPVVQHRLGAMNVLVKLDSKEADALVQSLASDESLIHWLSAPAIQRATARDLELPEAALLTALADPHADTRNAAVLHWKKQFGAEPAVRFVPVEVVQSPKFREFLDRFGDLLIDPLPAHTPWVEIKRTWKREKDGKPENEVEAYTGWLVEKEGERVRILDLHGRILEFNLGEHPNDGWRGDSTVTFRESPIVEQVDEIEALRKKGDPENRLSAQGRFSGQFQGTAAGLPEMLLALQLHRSGKPDLCARILFPALDTYPEDKVFFEVAKHRLATGYGYRMIVEFVGNRDYDKALAVAARIERDFKETRFHELARRLLAELPKRRDDFRGLILPTRADWEAWRARHGREEQIRFLCERLRLLNCYQYGQPSDVELFDHQYSEPCGLSIEASQNLYRGKTKVINPLEELLGNPEPVSDDVDEEGEDIKLPPIPGMKLGIRDVPAIAPFLRDDQLILSVGYWREFHPSRTVTGTRELLAWVLSRASKRELVNEKEWQKLNEEQIAHKIDAMITWAKERADKSETDLLLETLSDLGAGGGDWFDARNAADELVKIGERRAFPLIAHWLKHPETDDYEIEAILPLLGQLDAAKAKDHALAYLDHKDPGIRLEAAMIVLKAGDAERALTAIGKAFSEVNYSNVTDEEMDTYAAAVMKLDTPKAWDALVLLFDDIGIATLDDFDSVSCCRALESHGNPAGLRFYRSLLDNRETGIPNMVGWGRPIAHKFGDKLLEGYAEHDPAAKKILAGTKVDSEERLAAIKTWLDERLRKLEKTGK